MSSPKLPEWMIIPTRWSQIDKTLWVGSWPSDGAPTFPQYIVNLYPWGQYEIHPHQLQLTARLYDAGEIPDETLLHHVADQINKWRAQGPTLVHCQQGLNRSPLVVALALIKSGMSPPGAIQLLRKKRGPQVLFNRVFEQWLLEKGARQCS